METQTTHRRRDGSIDFDFYRLEAAALRRRAIQDAFRSRTPARPKTVAAVMAGVIIAACSFAHRFTFASAGQAAVSTPTLIESGPAAREDIFAFARQRSGR